MTRETTTMPRRFTLQSKTDPTRLLADGVLFWGGKVAVFDYRFELVLVFNSIESALRDQVQAVELVWIDAAPVSA